MKDGHKLEMVMGGPIFDLPDPKPDWYRFKGQLLRALRVNTRLWYYDPTIWLRENMPTLAAYL